MAVQQSTVTSKKTSPVQEDHLVELMMARSIRDSPIGRGSPADSPLARRAAMSLLLGVPSSDLSLNDSVMSWSMDEDDSSRDSPGRMGGVSPEPVDGHKRHSLKQYKNELWAAIRPDFMYLMDEEIIDACKSTESEISSDELCVETKVSYNEFLQQYRELTDWLGYLQLAVSRQTASRSESYLNQMYHEEMLTQSPRQQLFKDYAKELLRRYPQLKQEIMSHLTHVSELWCEVMDKLILPSGGGRPDLSIILKDIEEDVVSLRLWVNAAEKAMTCLSISPEWSLSTIQAKLIEHQAVQKDIESRSRVVSAVMKLCEWMDKLDAIDDKLEAECGRLHITAASLEKRWHGIWIQSVEWQVRLEDALSGRHTRKHHFFNKDQMASQASVFSEQFKTIDSDNQHTDYDLANDLTDGGNSDVIPFRESDYEEIVGSDQDDFDEKQDLDVELCRSGHNGDRHRMVLDAYVEREFDIELGQELSDHSVELKEYEETQSASESLNLTSGDLRLNGCEIFDIGYSSESHSFDERETGGFTMQMKEQVDKLNRPGCIDDTSETAEVLPVGRQSATSAYNSLSDLSDNHRPPVVCELPQRVPHSSYYCTANVDLNDSSVASSVDHKHHQIPRMISSGINDDCCTDDDFSKLKELSFDDIPMVFMDDDREVCESMRLPRRQGRSLDSLLPFDCEKMFKFEKRVSSVEVIIDSLAVSKDLSANVCAEIMLNNEVLTSKAERGTSDPSSCDASSEGTVSDSECSESVVSGDDCTPRKFKSARRTKREKARQDTMSKYEGSGQVKSPMKRRGDSLTDISDIAEFDRCLRSSSDGAINDLTSGLSTVKRSKVSRTQSDVLFEKSIKISSTPRMGMQSDGRSPSAWKGSPRKTRKQAVTQLKFDSQEDTDVSNVSNDYSVSNMNSDAMDESFENQDVSMYSDMQCQQWDTDGDSSYVKDDVKSSDKSGRSKCGRSSLIVSNRSGSRQPWEDSDSDTEDFLNIVVESRKAFTFTESTLQKFLKDYVDGVIRDPVEFMEPLATCQTNVKCMLELVDALESGTKMRDADNKIQQINNIISHWQQLEAQTVSQQQQCRLLHILYTERIRCEKQLSAMLREISVDKFDDLPGLETMCHTVQSVRCELQTKVDHQLKLLGHKVNQFHNAHGNVDTSRFDASIEQLQKTVTALLDLCNRKESYLKKSLMAWYQLTELQCHLEYVISHEEQQIDCLDIAADIVHLSQDDLNDTVSDLQDMNRLCSKKFQNYVITTVRFYCEYPVLSDARILVSASAARTMRESWSVHNDKLQLMESLRGELLDVCTVDGQVVLDSTLGMFSNRLKSLGVKCDKMIERMTSSSMNTSDIEFDDHMNTDNDHTLDSLNLKPETCIESSQNEDNFEEEVKIESLKSDIQEKIAVEKQEETVMSSSVEQAVDMKTKVVHNTVSSNTLRRFLKYALPLPLILMFIFGGLYLLYDDWFECLDQYGLVIAPQLRHVRGAPPV